MTGTRLFTIVFQVLAGLIQLGNLASGVVPARWQWVVALVVAVAQAFQAQRAHFFNPDGTDAATPYTP